jgi:CubicO group peptidase (beta-lactamase class C family)
MSLFSDRLTTLIAGAGYGSQEPVIVGVHRQGRAPVFVSQGVTGAGEQLSSATVTYAASLSKQITAACAAVLVQEGALDMEAMLAYWMPELPAWAGTVRLRHLLYHTAALPGDTVGAIVGSTADWTTPAVLSALAQVPALGSRPGATYTYSGAGYVCLAVVVERAAGQPLPIFAENRIFTTLGMNTTRYWPEPVPPGAAPLAAPHPAPLSLGDGGVWSTASDLVRWGQALNADELGISPLMETPGSLDDGTPLDYAWGMGIRSHAGYRVYRHGGGWPGLRALLARVPDLNLSLVIIALADNSERRIELAAGMLDLVTAPSCG